MLLLLLLLLQSRCLFNVRFFSLNGRVIPDKPKSNRFIIQIQTEQYLHILSAYNHEYRTQIPFTDDPCIWVLSNNGQVVGKYNTCNGRIDYLINGKKYTIKYGKNTITGFETVEDEDMSKMNSDPINIGNKEFSINSNKSIENVLIKKSIKQMNNKKYSGSSNSTKSISVDDRRFQLNIFVFNDVERQRVHGNNIKDETKKLIEMVDDIYKKNRMDIRINLMGCLSLKNEIQNNTDKAITNLNFKYTENSNILSAFKRMIEPIKYDSHNLETPLSKSDLSILLISRPIKTDPEELYQHHGMTYYGGANGLNRSYSVVYAGNSDSMFFIAKKMAHEIAHSLGVRHDESTGFIMETSTCNTCEDAPRKFSKESKAQMKRFLEEYEDVFLIRKSLINENDGKVIMSKEAAIAYVKSQRKHGFTEIVNMRLKGRTPETSYFTYYLGVSFAFYMLSIFVAIYYLK